MKSKELTVISKLSSYKGRYILFRIGAVSIVALVFMLVADKLVAGDGLDVPLEQYFNVIIIFNIITELNVLLDNIFERFFPVPSKISLRALLHFLLSLVIGFLALGFFETQVHHIEVLQQPLTWLMFAFGLIFVFILIVISISIRITTQWLATKQEVEKLRELQMKNDYNALQDQLNPHFLFNNLSVLKSMITYNQEAAVAFTQHFTDTYRYVLQNRDRTTVPLSDELGFIKSYVALHKERLGDGLEVIYDIGPSLLSGKIPPLSLQLLIENAIKHNIVAADEPLIIRLFSKDDAICAENNFQPKESSYSTSKGLKNLVARYTFLTTRKVVVVQDENIFRVELPLL